MATLKITELELPGVKIIEPTYFEDYRGYYCETYSSRTMAQIRYLCRIITAFR